MRDAGITVFHFRAAILIFSEEGTEHFLLTAYEGERPDDCTCKRGQCEPRHIVPGIVTQHEP